jgi:hypothetical protein
LRIRKLKKTLDFGHFEKYLPTGENCTKNNILLFPSPPTPLRKGFWEDRRVGHKGVVSTL